MKPTFRSPCPQLNIIVRVKHTTKKNLKIMINKFVNSINKQKDSINIKLYQEQVCKEFIVDFNSVLKSAINDDDNALADIQSLMPKMVTETQEEYNKDLLSMKTALATKLLYESVINLYPDFDLANICNVVNAKVSTPDAGLKRILDAKSNAVHPMEYSTSSMNLSEINNIESSLKKTVIGQNEAIEATINAFKLVNSGLESMHSMFFVGPTGTGKTMISKQIANKFNYHFFKVNCAEYGQSHETAKLIGSPPGYIGHSEKSILSEKAEVSSKWVILFDEIEKAHPRLQEFLLSMLDDGTVTDNLGRTLNFSNSVFIFTSNQGMKDINLGSKTIGFDKSEVKYENSKDQIVKSIKSKFSPEFLNRIDNIIHFNQLTEEDAAIIAKNALAKINIKRTPTLIKFIVKNGYSTEYGARNINRFIKNHIKIKVADEILNNRIPDKGNLYHPKIVNNELTIINSIDYKEYEKLQKCTVQQVASEKEAS